MQRLIIALAILLPAFALAQQNVSSTRDTSYDWRCETSAGTTISDHVRQDKAQQSCWNQALRNPGEIFIVRGGTYRSVASADASAPVERYTTLRWIAPTKNTDGSALRPGELTKFNIYLETPTEKLLGVVAGTATAFIWVTTETGEHCFSATAVSTNESARSNVSCRDL